MKKHKKRVHKEYKEKINPVLESFKEEVEEPHKYGAVNKYRQVKCGLCVIDFETVSEMDDHMDANHGGRWKLGDPDVVFEGDDYEESSESEVSTSEEFDMSNDESSESQSGEDMM